MLLWRRVQCHLALALSGPTGVLIIGTMEHLEQNSMSFIRNLIHCLEIDKGLIYVGVSGICLFCL